MTNVQAIRFLQDVATYLVAQERTIHISRAEYAISDAILDIWNDHNTDRAEYWQ